MNQPKGHNGPLASRQFKRKEVEARKTAREKIIAKIRGGTSTDTKRYLLPSCRVAEFAYPNVGEYLKLNEQAVLLAAREQGAEATDLDMIYHVKEAALRRMLVGISPMPIPVVMKPGWDEDAARERAIEAVEAMARDAVRKKLEIAEDAPLGEKADRIVRAEVDRLTIAGAIERDVFRQRLDFEDVPATLAMANVQPVNDSDFDDPDHYLRQIQNARIGSVEADDWMALHGVTGGFISELESLRNGATFGDPKAEDGKTPKMTFRRPFRS